jgi:hypothetical protein
VSCVAGKVVNRDESNQARTALLTHEKEHTVGGDIRAHSPFRRGPLSSLGDVEEITAAWVHGYNTNRLMHRLDRRPPAEYETATMHRPWRPTGRSHVTKGAPNPGRSGGDYDVTLLVGGDRDLLDVQRPGLDVHAPRAPIDGIPYTHAWGSALIPDEAEAAWKQATALGDSDVLETTAAFLMIVAEPAVAELLPPMTTSSACWSPQRGPTPSEDRRGGRAR